MESAGHLLEKISKEAVLKKSSCGQNKARIRALMLSLSLLLAQVGLAPVHGAALSSRKPSFDLPANDIIDEDLPVEDNKKDSASDNADLKSINLAPLKLKDATQEEAQPAGEKANGAKEGEEGTLKVGATINQFVPKENQGGTTGGDLPKLDLKDSTSAKDEKGGRGFRKGKKDKVSDLAKGTVHEQAKALNLQPVALMESPEEVQDKAKLLEDSEKQQIAGLWESTLERNPKIQFVVQKLVPTSDKGHATHIMMKSMSSLLFGAIGSMGMIAPNQGTYMAQNFAASLLGQLNGSIDKKALERMSLNQAELIMLYEMVTNTAQDVVDNYRSYKKNVQHMSRATTDLEELRNMAGLAAKTPAQELEMQYTLRKAQRDVDSLVDDVHRYRQNLIDLAGREAVDKLDNLMNDEMQKLENTQIAPSLKTKPNM
ncbi:MAG: hypothetical protein K2Y32_22275 [Candidatus Obscuribacterales bacterium]|nr:hypothetical protein [Candidatus Obscuribacterales bacterium]